MTDPDTLYPTPQEIAEWCKPLSSGEFPHVWMEEWQVEAIWELAQQAIASQKRESAKQ